ncbi:MAG: prenyltransferase/squalene oxidase repeat-containing protein [Akkermansia sp.]
MPTSPMLNTPLMRLILFCILSFPLSINNAHAQNLTRFNDIPTNGDNIPPQVESIYLKGLRFLQQVQKEDGSFGSNYDKDPAIAGFCLMSILAHGDDPNVGPFANMAKKCLSFILSQQNKKTGYIGSSMYSHGFATLALSEAYGYLRDDRIGPALKKAVELTLTAQEKNPLGGWRYSPDATDADTSVTGCQIVSLYAARNAGIPIPDKNLTKALRFMASCRDNEGIYGYVNPSGGRTTLSAIGLLTLSLAKQKKDSSYNLTSRYLVNKINHRESTYPFYFEYYMSQALFHSNEKAWQEWNLKNIRYMASTQSPNGSWLSSSGNAYATSVALLSLAVNFRLLPIYEK